MNEERQNLQWDVCVCEGYGIRYLLNELSDLKKQALLQIREEGKIFEKV